MPSGPVTGSVLSFTGAAPEDASNVNELARDRHDALRHDHVPEHHAHAPQQDDASPGSEVSHSCFPENRLFQLRLSHQLLQPGILLLKLFQTHRLIAPNTSATGHKCCPSHPADDKPLKYSSPEEVEHPLH